MSFPALFAFQVDPGMRVGTLLRADPNSWGSVLVAVGINVNPRPSRGVYWRDGRARWPGGVCIGPGIILWHFV